MADDEPASLRRVADYQFGAGAGRALFPDDDAITVSRTKSGRPRQVHAGEARLVTYGRDGRFTLGVAGGHRLAAAFDHPRHRVVVGSESDPYVREGRNAFAKFVRAADEGIRPGDEVLVVDGDDHLLGVGRAELPGPATLAFETGMAVQVREGAGPVDEGGSDDGDEDDPDHGDEDGGDDDGDQDLGTGQ